MKRFFSYFILLLGIIFLSFFFQEKKTNTISVFQTNLQYDTYTLTFPKPLSFSQYQQLFSSLNKEDYKILSFSFENHYSDRVQEKINQISLRQGDYFSALDEYLKNYKNILYDFDLYLDIDRLNRNDFLITQIVLYSNYDVYLYFTSHSSLLVE